MEKSVHTPLYEPVKARLRAMREAAGLSQRELAAKLKRERSFVARIEQGERRVDVLEWYWICEACGVSAEQAARDLLREIRIADRSRKKS